MNDAAVASRAKGLGIRSVPAVVIDGELADCCTGRGPDEATLRSAGLGQATVQAPRHRLRGAPRETKIESAR